MNQYHEIYHAPIGQIPAEDLARMDGYVFGLEQCKNEGIDNVLDKIRAAEKAAENRAKGNNV